MSLPAVCCYGPNNSGKSDRMLVYSACCGVAGGKNKSKLSQCFEKSEAELGQAQLLLGPLVVG